MIDLEKHDEKKLSSQSPSLGMENNTNSYPSPTQEIDDDDIEPRPGDDNIHGWLAFFLFTIGIGGLLTLVLNIANIQVMRLKFSKNII